MMSSLIATAVQERCAATATSPVTAPLPDVTQAGEVFNAYCARSTELAWCMYHFTRYVACLLIARQTRITQHQHHYQ
jgi:hypothetical protein